MHDLSIHINRQRDRPANGILMAPRRPKAGWIRRQNLDIRPDSCGTAVPPPTAAWATPAKARGGGGGRIAIYARPRFFAGNISQPGAGAFRDKTERFLSCLLLIPAT